MSLSVNNEENKDKDPRAKVVSVQYVLEVASCRTWRDGFSTSDPNYTSSEHPELN